MRNSHATFLKTIVSAMIMGIEYDSFIFKNNALKIMFSTIFNDNNNIWGIVLQSS